MVVNKVYLAGPMRGVAEFNFPAFDSASSWLRGQGFHVFNPAERDVAKYGVELSQGNLFGDEAQAKADHGFDLREALGADLAWITEHAEAVAVLPGWGFSAGARAEVAVACALGLVVLQLAPCVYDREWLSFVVTPVLSARFPDNEHTARNLYVGLGK